MSKQEQLEKKVVDAYAAYVDAGAVEAAAAYLAYVAYVAAETKAALAAGAYAAAAYVDTGNNYIKAMDELKEYKEQDNE